MHVPSLKLFALTLTAIGILSVSSLAVTLNSVTITAPPFTTPYTVRVGGAIQLIATANYSDGTHTNVTALATWTSSNSQVASVNTGPASSGGITSGVKAGSATVVAAYSGKQGNASLTVNQVAIPANFFGMHLNHYNNPVSGQSGQLWPVDVIGLDPNGAHPIGAERLWDTATGWSQLSTSCQSNPNTYWTCTYNWTNLDNRVNLAISKNVQILYNLARTPFWATSNPNDTSCAYYTGPGTQGQCDAPSDLAGGTGDWIWKTWVHDVSCKYAGKIKYYEIWNEVNVGGMWSGGYPNLATMEADAYAEIKACDPNAIVVSPSFTNGLNGVANGTTAYINAGGDQHVDAIAFHGYIQQPPADPVAENVVTLINNLKNNALANHFTAANSALVNLPLLDTEGSWGKTDPTTYPFYDQERRVVFLTRYLILQWSSNVASHYWYTWDNVGSGTFWDTINTNSSGCNGTGTALTSQQGGGWLCQPGLAYERLNQWIQGGSLITNCASLTAPNGDILWQCDLTRSTPTAGYRGRLIWDTSKTCTQGGNPACPTYTYTVPTPNPFTQYRTLDSGTAITIGSGQVPLTAKPILLENFSEF